MNTYIVTGADKNTGKDRTATCYGDDPNEAERQAGELGILAATTTLRKRDVSILMQGGSPDETPTEAYLRVLCFHVRLWSRLIGGMIILAAVYAILSILTGK